MTNLRNVRSASTDRARTFTFRPLSTTRFTEEDLNRVSIDLPSSRLSIGMMKPRCKVGGTTMISLTKRKKKAILPLLLDVTRKKTSFTLTDVSQQPRSIIHLCILSLETLRFHHRYEIEQTLSVFHKASFSIIGSLARYLSLHDEIANLQTIEIHHAQRFPCILKESDRVRRIFSWTYVFSSSPSAARRP